MLSCSAAQEQTFPPAHRTKGTDTKSKLPPSWEPQAELGWAQLHRAQGRAEEHGVAAGMVTGAARPEERAAFMSGINNPRRCVTETLEDSLCESSDLHLLTKPRAVSNNKYLPVDRP